ncbi:MAG: hypothetical protein AB7O66_16270 [Limisphaerales bacterium]
MDKGGELSEVLRENLALYGELWTLVLKERDRLHGESAGALTGTVAARKDLLPRLGDSLDRLVAAREKWQDMAPAERSSHPEVGTLMRQNQDLLMKILVLDRENEQSLLRHGLVPARELPSVNRQRPHFVAQMYRRQSGSS